MIRPRFSSVQFGTSRHGTAADSTDHRGQRAYLISWALKVLFLLLLSSPFPTVPYISFIPVLCVCVCVCVSISDIGFFFLIRRVISLSLVSLPCSHPLSFVLLSLSSAFALALHGSAGWGGDHIGSALGVFVGVLLGLFLIDLAVVGV
ncbi:hypothetical protein N658DRAFT_5275 [Parathielavia hyrcaniae]|uniref:Uncharacterized protein n=1 Tax=Parathielavia hyrcaniae TaxID=113614 RepID=A0AAN6QF37_9PEZI|nr:hypothetical protein N658DRAFT_5275 [Parathielavia hyrcaniae]